MTLNPLLGAFGFVVGTLVGLTGMGGSALMAPLLIMIGIRPIAVVGTDLAYSTLMKLVGAGQHLRFGTVDLVTVRRLALGSVPGVLLGVTLLKLVPSGEVDHVITRVLAGALMLVAASMLLRAAYPDLRLSTPPPWTLTPVGFVVGLLVGVTSVGSGSLIVAVLALTTTLPGRNVVGTDLAHAFLLVAAGALAHWQAGNIDFGLTANLLVGAVPGVLLGSRLSVRLPDKVIRPTLAVVLFATGLKML